MVFPVQEQPCTIPVIDFSGLNDPAKRNAICTQVAHACETAGFFEIGNSGMNLQAVDEAFDINQEFFNRPFEERIFVKKKSPPRIPIFRLGYNPFPVLAGVANRVESMRFRHYPYVRPGNETDKTISSSEDVPEKIDDAQNWWPSTPLDYRQKMECAEEEFGKLADTMLDVFSESLGLPSTFLREEQHKNKTVPRYMNVNHYPQGMKPEVDETGILPHRDSSIFTILIQGYDANGLQINPFGKWIPWMPQREAVIVNVGDALRTWSNGRYKSILHRVISNKSSSRLSFSYFVFPTPGSEEDYICEPIAKLINEANPAKFQAFSYLDFFNKKSITDTVSMLDKVSTFDNKRITSSNSQD